MFGMPDGNGTRCGGPRVQRGNMHRRWSHCERAVRSPPPKVPGGLRKGKVTAWLAAQMGPGPVCHCYLIISKYRVSGWENVRP